MSDRLLPAIAAVLSLSLATAADAAVDFELVNRADVSIQPLNPLRGDASPKAGVLWGDIKMPVASGTLVQFRDGFSSPPHIHNITYRAVVISGQVHNDDPQAERLWMGPGSFWTQPAGEVHITAAKGEATTIFLEIMDGPYLVRPSDAAFDNGERPVNVAARNVVWLDPSDVSWVEAESGEGAPNLAFLWGEPKDGERHGAFLRLQPGSAGRLESTGEWLRAVVVGGQVRHQRADGGGDARLEAGSYFGGPSGIQHDLACDAASECTFYVTAKGKFVFTSR